MLNENASKHFKINAILEHASYFQNGPLWSHVQWCTVIIRYVTEYADYKPEFQLKNIYVYKMHYTWVSKRMNINCSPTYLPSSYLSSACVTPLSLMASPLLSPCILGLCSVTLVRQGWACAVDKGKVYIVGSPFELPLPTFILLFTVVEIWNTDNLFTVWLLLGLMLFCIVMLNIL